MKFKKLVFAAIAAVLLFVPVLSSTTYVSASQTDRVSKNFVKDVKADVLKRVNKYRSKHHLGKLRYNKSLEKLGQRVSDGKMAYILGGYDRHITSKKMRGYFKVTAKKMKYKNAKSILEADSRTWDVKRMSAKATSKNSSQYYLNYVDKKALLKKNAKTIGIGVSHAFNTYNNDLGQAPYETIIEIAIK